jgi:hypothetical protein
MNTQLLNAARECVADLAHYVSTHGPGPDRRLELLKSAIEEAESGYQGWTNYETWAVNLWLGNEQVSSNYWNETAQNAYDEAKAGQYLTRMEAATIALSETLKAEIEEAAPELENGMFSDLLNAALSEVNWREIAEAYLDNVNQEAAAE